MKLAAVVLLLTSCFASAQVHRGELRLTVTDSAGRGLKAVVTVSSVANEYHGSFTTDAQGLLDIKTLAYGRYLVRAGKEGFAEASRTLDIRSAMVIESGLQLGIAPLTTVVQVSDASTLIDPYRPSSTMQIGTQQIEDRTGSLPGRSVQDLVNSQPGWLYEGNAVLHPRGSEYQTQIVMDGIPLTDNRSPGLGPEIEADDVVSSSIYTAGFPAEYGRKMGGVIELNTRREAKPGLHGQLVLSGGSYATAASYGQVQEQWGKNTLGGSAAGSRTSHYLNPVVPENYTNTGTTGDFTARYERELSDSDRVNFSVRHELTRFLIPNELVQQQAGQVQHGDNFETLGTVNLQHAFSAESLGVFAGMVRDNASNLSSNAESTPILAFQHNSFREAYFKGTLSVHRGIQELKGGAESDTTWLHENFNYTITDPAQFDDTTPPVLTFTASRPDLEQAAFVEDLIRLGKWTVSAGLRWDHYQLLLNQNAFSPRISVGRFLPSLNVVLHGSYDRVFQTPSFENILISSSNQVEALSDHFLRLPVQPSRGNYYEGGLSKGLADRVRVDVNLYRRDASNYADDDHLLNTGVGYPIAFDRSVIYGAEGRVELVELGQLSGFVSYSYMVGKVWFPVTGGLFLGGDAGNASAEITGHFPDSQDQRNTVRTRLKYQMNRRMWFAAGASYGSGLPFQYGGTEADALIQYGPQVIDRINFARGRIRPVLALDSSMAVEMYKSERFAMRIQADGENLNGRLNVIDFGGLFSGNAIAPGRSFALRLNTSF